MELTMQNLIKCFEGAKEERAFFIGVRIKMFDMPAEEVIINSQSNFDAKLEYYKKAYNDDLTLKANPGIKITGFTYGYCFDDIGDDLV